MLKNVFKEVFKKISKIKINKNVVEYQNKTQIKANNNIDKITWVTDKEKRMYRKTWVK
tara:strand:- start:968 stop:1141 length:174 start_codon:yes stop_codon:yes gene_type:complete